MSIRLRFQITILTLISVLLVPGVPSADHAGTQKAEPLRTGTVTGRIMVKDKNIPLSWGQIMFYDISSGPPPIPDKYERTPDISKNMDGEGRFKIEVPEGRYYMGAISRASGDRLGPPLEGDYVFRSLDEKGKPREYLVKAGETLDVGTFAEAFLITAEDISRRRVTTALEGSIFNTDWLPVEGAVVVAFAEPTLGKKPLFVSSKSDKEGKYILPITEGTYYLRVRNSFAAGPPEPGQIVGYYGEGTPSPVRVKECEIVKDVDFQVVVFRGRGPAPKPGPQTR